MIKINLLGEVKPVDTSGRLWVLGYVVSLIVLGAVSFFMYEGVAKQAEDFASENELLQKRVENLKKQTKSVEDLEAKQHELEEKIKVITTLKRSKTGPVRVLDDVNIAIPERAWLSSMNESEGTLKISGLALDNPTVSDFMKALVLSDYVENVELIESKSTKVTGLDIKSFVLDVKINYAGKVKAVPTPAAAAAVPTAAPTAAPTVAANGAEAAKTSKDADSEEEK